MTPAGDPRSTALPGETPDRPSSRRAWLVGSDGEGTNPWREGDLATNVTSYLLAGPLAFGGLGWLASLGLGSRWPVPVGMLLGVGLSVYVIWLRYGRP